MAEGPAHAEGRRQRHAALARDPERRHHRRQLRVQQQPDVELRRPGERLHDQRRHRLRRGQLPARLRASKTRNLFDAETYTEKRPEYSLYVQDDFRVVQPADAQRRPALGRVRAVDREGRPQSNFDESTGRFVVASDDAVIDGVEVGRYLQTYSKSDLGPRLGFAYDVSGDGRTSSAAASASSGTSRPAARRRRRRRTRRSCSRRR